MKAKCSAPERRRARGPLASEAAAEVCAGAHVRHPRPGPPMIACTAAFPARPLRPHALSALARRDGVAAPRRSHRTRSSPTTSRAGSSGTIAVTGPLRPPSWSRFAAILSAASSALDSHAPSALAVARGLSWPSPARAATSARPAMAGTWPRPPPITPSRLCLCGSG